MLNKAEGIVIHTTDYGEANKIVTIHTKEHGKLGLMARGAKKTRSKLAAGTQILTYGHFLYNKGRGLGTLHQADPLDLFRYIKADIVPMAYASYIVDTIHKLGEKDVNNPYLYEWVLQILNYMEEGLDPQVLTFIYEIKLLPILGIAPEVDHCVRCHRTEGLSGFSIAGGGTVCDLCLRGDQEAVALSPITVKLLRLFKHIDIHRIGKIELKKETRAQLKSIINAYYDAYSGLNLKTKRFIEQIESLDSQEL